MDGVNELRYLRLVRLTVLPVSTTFVRKEKNIEE